MKALARRRHLLFGVAASFLFGAAMGACSVEPAPYEGFACEVGNPELGCLDGRVCIDGVCRTEGEEEDAGDGGNGGVACGDGGERLPDGGCLRCGDAGFLDAGICRPAVTSCDAGVASDGGCVIPDAGAPPDAGLRWSQAQHGFSAERERCVSCGLQIDAGNNALVAIVDDSASGFAFGRVDAGNRLPPVQRGRLKGKIRFSPSGNDFDATARILNIQAQQGTFLVLSVTRAGTLSLYSDPGMFSSVVVTHGGRVDGGFRPNETYDFDLRWDRGVRRELFVDGEPIITDYTPGTLGAVNMVELDVGVQLYRPDAGVVSVSTAFQDFVLVENPDVVLP